MGKNVIIYGVHKVLRNVISKVRLIWYWATVFIWYDGIPSSTKIFGKLRFPYVPCRLVIGRNCILGHNILISAGRKGDITFGRMVTVNDGCIFVAVDEITIGDNVSIGEYVSIRDQQHRFVPGEGIQGQGFDVSPVRIGDNTWVGRGAFIGPGTRIGRNCIVAANSVVHGEFSDGVLIAGAPARERKTLTSFQE